MNKVLFAVLFSVLLLVPIGAQQVFANPGNTLVTFGGPGPGQETTHTDFPITDPDGILSISNAQALPGCPVGPVTFRVTNTLLPIIITIIDCEPDGDTTQWEFTLTGVTCVAGSCLPPIGGEIIPIETTSLILAGAQTFSWMIPVVLSVLGIGMFVVVRKNE